MSNTERLELIDFQFKKKAELEKIKFDFFSKKQTLMDRQITKIWDLKNKYQDKKHKQQLEKIRISKK